MDAINIKRKFGAKEKKGEDEENLPPVGSTCAAPVGNDGTACQGREQNAKPPQWEQFKRQAIYSH